MLVTFSLNCFNQKRFIRDAIRGAFAQDYEPLEILISDNHSTDGTFDIVEDEIKRYTGPHLVRVIRQSRNIGWEIFAATAEAARGEFVVDAHGDDISYPERTRYLVETWRATNASLLSSNCEIIDANSRPQGLLNPKDESKWVPPTDLIKGYSKLMHGACLAWHPDVFRKFAPLDNSRLHAAYDHVLPFRGGLLTGSYYVSRPLLRMRLHGKNFGTEPSSDVAYVLGARVCMLEDLDHLAKENGNRVQFRKLRELLVERILSLTRSCCRERNELFANGLRPIWVRRYLFRIGQLSLIKKFAKIIFSISTGGL
jgi:glycosyltransferase involved in cell wall biosynthesis